MPTPVIHDRQDPKRPSISQGIMHEIHAPAFSWTGWYRGWATMQRDVLPPPHAHPQLQSLQSIEPSYPLPIHEPAFAPQQHPDPQVAEPGSGVGQIANAEPETGLILRPTSSIPGGSTELRQPAGPRTPHLERGLKPLSQFPAADGPQTFFRRASDSMCLSSERSATSRFKRLFSSSTCRSRRSSLT